MPFGTLPEDVESAYQCLLVPFLRMWRVLTNYFWYPSYRELLLMPLGNFPGDMENAYQSFLVPFLEYGERLPTTFGTLPGDVESA